MLPTVEALPEDGSLASAWPPARVRCCLRNLKKKRIATKSARNRATPKPIPTPSPTLSGPESEVVTAAGSAVFDASPVLVGVALEDVVEETLEVALNVGVTWASFVNVTITPFDLDKVTLPVQVLASTGVTGVPLAQLSADASRWDISIRSISRCASTPHTFDCKVLRVDRLRAITATTHTEKSLYLGVLVICKVYGWIDPKGQKPYWGQIRIRDLRIGEI